MDEKGITAKKEENISEWYEQVCLKSNIADFGEVKGTIVIKPKGYYMWEQIQEWFKENLLKPLNVPNAYFPLFIPERFFKKEAEHAEGFAPELAWAATAQDEEGEKAIIRPTSETIIVDQFRKWLRNYKELPIKVNQWCNVVRWEVKQTKLFLRSREFLWQEGHCIYETEEECEKDVLAVLEKYVELAKDMLALPTLSGLKTKEETFPGAIRTYTFEALMPDGKSLQSGTSHYLGTGFMKAFDVKFTGRDEKDHHPHYNSWGISTRLLGATIMTHSDDKGLVLPPKLARDKVVIIPLFKKEMSEEMKKEIDTLKEQLAFFNPIVDERTEYSMGWKLSENELQGTPLVIVVGQKELEEGKLTIKLRDEEKKQINRNELDVQKELDEFHKRLYEKAKIFLDSRIVDVSSIDEMKKAVSEGKLARAFYCGEKEKEFVEEHGFGTRCIDTENTKEGTCVVSGEQTKNLVYFGRSY